MAKSVSRPTPPPDLIVGRNGTSPLTRQDVVIALPRRRVTSLSKAEPSKAWSAPRMKVAVTPKVGRILFVARLLVWIGMLLTFALGTFWDVVRRRDSEERRAVRLRRAIEKKGGTLVRIGRQMAVRLDILPVRYCEQLSQMRDKMPAFPIRDTIAIFERTTGRKLNQVFSTFDPVPIDSSSVRCVYQAVLRHTNDKVVVKVRRPGIHVVFEADYKALVFLVRLAEALTFIRPGYGEGFYTELRKTLLDELNFRRCARYEELFARRARKLKKKFFTTPMTYGDLLSEEVMVQEFVSGMWLWEILAALEQKDETGLTYMRELNIDPRKVARRLLMVHHWAVFEHKTFNADPHSANILVRANSNLVLLDFGANGHVDGPRRELFSRFYESQAKQDIWGMAQSTLALLEPLPACDLNTMGKEIEGAYYERFLAVKSRHSRWHERTSAAMWLAAFQILNKYKIPVQMDVLMYVRATLFYDTLAARLWENVDYFKEFRRYARDARKRRRKRGVKEMQRRLEQGLIRGADFRFVEKLATTASDLFFRLQRILNVPYDFAVITLTVEKWVVTLVTAFRFTTYAAALTGLGVLAIIASSAVSGSTLALQDSLQSLFASGWYQLAIGLLAVMHIRLILFRLADKARRD